VADSRGWCESSPNDKVLLRAKAVVEILSAWLPSVLQRSFHVVDGIAAGARFKSEHTTNVSTPRSESFHYPRVSPCMGLGRTGCGGAGAGGVGEGFALILLIV
jgi:hypothetical protein